MSVIYGDPSKVSVQQVVSGTIIQIKIGAQEIGRAQSADARRQFGQEGVYAIGSIMPQEHVALRYEGSFTVDSFYVRTKSLADIGLASLGVGILRMNVVDIVISDKYVGQQQATITPIRGYRNASLNDYSENFRANAISGENATWLYLTADNGTVGSESI
jgi:hypothetical protein